MSNTILLSEILNDMRAKEILPLVQIISGNSTYIIYRIANINGVQGYPITKVTTPTASHSYFETGFLPENTRIDGSNGSATDVNLKTDAVNSVLLIIDPLIVYN